MEFKELITALSNAWYVGGRGNALDIAEDELKPFAQCERLQGGLVAELKGESDYTVMLDAHIDEIAFFVTSVEGGFVKVAPAGGFDSRVLPASPVVIHGKKDAVGAFGSTPPHIMKGKSTVQKVDEMYIDTLSDDAAEFVKVGDIVTMSRSAAQMTCGAVTGKALDDRVACAVLIETAKRLSKQKLPCNVLISLSDAEEIGCRGAKINSFSNTPNEAIAVDVSFASGPDIPENKCGIPKKGVMIGVSPILSKAVTDKLKKICENKKIACQIEVMGGTTGTNADSITLTKGGIATGLCSIPLRNMHTPVETVWEDDLYATINVLYEYCLAGGALNA